MFGISLTGRLTTLFAVTSVAVLVGFGTFISSAIEKHFSEQDQLLLQKRIAVDSESHRGKRGRFDQSDLW